MQTKEIKLNNILCGKSEEKLKEFPDNFFDGTVTDPPYELNFMSKKWDASGIAYNVELWKEVLRVLKPGAYLLVFGGTRTHHRVACAIEDAGFIIKDEISWVYGEGFPKSTNISKQIDKEAGVEREIIGKHPAPLTAGNSKRYGWNVDGQGKTSPDLTAPATPDAKQWDGYGTGLKPAHEPIIVAMKPLENGLTYAQNAKKWGVAGLNIDGSRIKHNEAQRFTIRNCKMFLGQMDNTGINASANQLGRWPANIILSHSPDCVLVGTKIINEQKQEVWACVPDCPIRILDNQSGERPSGGQSLGTGNRKNQRQDKDGFLTGMNNSKVTSSYAGETGGASRFFYCAKAKKSEKEAGLKGFTECVKCGKFDSKTHTVIINGEKKKEKCLRNNHPTVKPLDLMKYLLGLIKMPSAKASVNNSMQVILDPFCGSGTTLVAAEQLGINYIGIDQDLDNILISTARIGV